MVSVIVCSVNEQLFRSISENIQQTIGVKYEIIRFDNTIHNVGIAEAYNAAAEKSVFPYLCFVHEDVRFKTKNWGEAAIAHFSRGNIGAIGLAGSIYKTSVVSSWWQPLIDGLEPKRGSIIQHYKHIQKAPEHVFFNPIDEIESPVVSLDGVFIFLGVDTWRDNKFDSTLIKGFHAYDLDFTVRVGAKQQVVVVYDILLDHYSEGTNDKDWFLGNVLVHQKLRNMLPIIIAGVDLAIVKKAEISYLRHNLGLIEGYNLTRSEKFILFTHMARQILSQGINREAVSLFRRLYNCLVN